MKILVAYDGSLCADAAIENMRRAGLPEEAEALILYVADAGLRPDFDEIDACAQAADRLKSYFPRWRVSEETLWGPAAAVILEKSSRWQADLLVAGSHGRSAVGRVFLGSVSAELVHKSVCPVRVARRIPRVGPIRIIVAIDGSPEAAAAIRVVEQRHWPPCAEAHIVSVIETLVPALTPLEASTFAHEPAYRIVAAADERARERRRDAVYDSANRLHSAGLTATAAVIEGNPGPAIVEEANRQEADSVFLGARGLGRVERFLLGSVSTYVLTHAHCAVEVVHR